MNIEFLSSLVTVLVACIAAVNIIVEVLKSFWLKSETSRPLAVLIVSEILAFAVVYVYCVSQSMAFCPLFGAGAFGGGFFIAYGAMFGYDKLYGAFFENIKNAVKRGEDID